MKSYFVYILKCSDGTLYTGSTNDIERRVLDHNESPRGAKYTKARRPVRLVYSEECPSKGSALSREAKIKRLTRIEKLELVSTQIM